MHLYAIVCALPDPSHYLVFHSHVDPDLAVWGEQDLQRYLTLQRVVMGLYETSEPDHLSPRDLQTLRPVGVSREVALQRLVPYRVEARRRTRNTAYLVEVPDSVERLEPVGIGLGPGQLQDIVIVRKAPQFLPTPTLLEQLRASGMALEACTRTGEPRALSDYRIHMDLDWDGVALDLDDLAFRRHPTLVWTVRRAPDPAALVHGGYAKVVTLPADVAIKLRHDKGGEIIKEQARFWS